jgi:phage host-nuclease inhibitor protein Gam
MTDFIETLGDPANTTLEDFLANAGQPDGFTGEAEAFAITNDDQALWAVRKVAQAQRRINEVKRQAQIELDRINRWVEANTTANAETVAYFERILGDYLVAIREDEQDGRKSLDFADGKVTSRVTPSKVAVEDLDAFLAWAEANGHAEWVRVKREADVSTIKKVVDFNGVEVIDPLTGLTVAGLSHTEGGLAVSVKVTD